VHHGVLCPTLTRGSGGFWSGASERPLALPLLVSAKELVNLIQQAGALLPPAQPEGALSGARGCHGGSGFGFGKKLFKGS